MEECHQEEAPIDPDSHLFDIDGRIVDVPGAHRVLDEIEPLNASPARTALIGARDAIVKGRATPAQLGLYCRAERIKDGLGMLQDHQASNL